MSDLIERQAAIKIISAHLPYVSEKRAEIILREVPSAQSEIIRCGECTYKDKKIDYCHYLGITICESDYCSYAERETDG